MKKKRILLVDDETSFTRLLKMNLEQTGDYQVREVNQGILALSAVEEFKPDLILMDVIMPDMDGGSIAGRLKDEGRLKDIPIIFLTAAVSKEEAYQTQGVIGGNMFIAKPVNLEKLLESIKSHLVERV